MNKLSKDSLINFIAFPEVMAMAMFGGLLIVIGIILLAIAV